MQVPNVGRNIDTTRQGRLVVVNESSCFGRDKAALIADDSGHGTLSAAYTFEDSREAKIHGTVLGFREVSGEIQAISEEGFITVKQVIAQTYHLIARPDDFFAACGFKFCAYALGKFGQRGKYLLYCRVRG